MKQTKLIALFFATYHIASFSSQHFLGLTCIGTPELRHWFEQMQLAEYQAAHQRIVGYNNQFPKISQEELDTWVSEKEREIKENQARYKKQQQEQQELRYYLKYDRKNKRQRSPYLKAVKKSLQDDHRNRYSPQIKTIECYPTRLLLEWKK